jgi:glycine/D-amino acid oxidase-like deaminating enzyme
MVQRLKPVDVVTIGVGLTGSLAALELAKEGLKSLGNLELVGKQNHLCDAWTLVLALMRCQALLVAPARYRCVAIRLEDLWFYLHILR